MMPQVFTLIGVLCGGLLLLLGGLMIFAVGLTVWKGMQSLGWPTASGRVVSLDDVPDRSALMPATEADATAAFPEMELAYEYEVEGRRLTGHAIQIRGNADPDRSRHREQELLKRYSAGESVVVYYNPRNSEDCALRPGIPRGMLAMTAWGAVLFLVGLTLAFFFSGAMKFSPSPRGAGLVFFVPGVALVCFGVRSIWFVVASRNWPTVNGKVTQSSIVPGSDTDRFQPSLIYEYEVQGEWHLGSAIDWGRWDMSRGDAQRIADKYRIGQSVAIHFDPMRPHRCVIEPRRGHVIFLVLFLGLSFTVIGAVLISGLAGG